MRNHLFESAYFDGTHSCSNSWRRSCECGPLNSLTPFWCREAKVWPTWLTFGEASLWCQHSSHPPSPPPWCDAGSRGQWSSSRCPPSPGPGASLPLWHHAPEPWQNTKINNNKHYIWYIQCYYTQSVSHYMDAICTKFATRASLRLRRFELYAFRSSITITHQNFVQSLTASPALTNVCAKVMLIAGNAVSMFWMLQQ